MPTFSRITPLTPLSDGSLSGSAGNAVCMATTEALLFGRRRGRSLAFVAGVTAAVVLALVASLVAQVASPEHPATRVLHENAVPLLLFYAPAPLAAAGGYARCGGPACLAVGVVPAVVFGALVFVGGVVGLPSVASDAPVWGVTLAYALAGLSSAFVGYCAGVTGAVVVDLVRG